MTDDPYAGKVYFGRLVREAARAAVHSEEYDDPEDAAAIQRVNDILVGEKFINDLVDGGCMITRIPAPPSCGQCRKESPMVELLPGSSICIDCRDKNRAKVNA